MQGMTLPRLSDDQLRNWSRDGFLVVRSLWKQSEAELWRQRLFAAAGTPPLESKEASQNASVGKDLGSLKPGPAPGARGRRQWGCRYEKPSDIALLDPDNPHGLLFVQGTNLLGDDWLSLSVEMRIVGAMISILGEDLNLHNMKASIKPPMHKTTDRQGFHQDSFYILEDPPDGFATLVRPCPPPPPPPPLPLLLHILACDWPDRPPILQCE